MKFIGTKILVIAMTIFSIAACSRAGAIEVGDKAPDFALANLDGKTVNLSDFSGKAVILNFFATWCPPCRQEVPDFIELQKAYGEKGFTFIGVALVDLKDAKSFAEKFGINYPVLVDDGKASEIYGPVRAIPTTFVIGKDGKVAKLYVGARSKGVFEADIKEMLK